MAKRTFFSFHYQDVVDFRANVVRNSWVTQDREQAGFFDASIWEKAKKDGDLALKRLINGGLDGTTATAVLIGTQTYARRWVRYEIMKSVSLGKPILGIHINGIKDKAEETESKGKNPFDYLRLTFSADGRRVSLSEWSNGKWQEYSDLAGFSCGEVAQKWKGKDVQLSEFVQVYDWIADDGYENLGIWVAAAKPVVKV